MHGQENCLLEKLGLGKSHFKSTLKTLPIKLNGSILLDNRYAFRDSVNAVMPPNYTRLWINAKVSVYEIPITLKTILTTEQHPERQSMNSFSIGFNAFDWKQVIKARLEARIARLKNDFTPQELEKMTQYMALVEKLDVDSLEGLTDVALEKLKERAKDSTGKVLAELKTKGEERAQASLERTEAYRSKTKKHEAKVVKLEEQKAAALAKADSGSAKYKKLEVVYEQRDQKLTAQQEAWQAEALKRFKDKKAYKQAQKYKTQAEELREKLPYKDAKDLGFDPSLIYNEDKLKKYQELKDLEKMKESLDAKAVSKLREIGFISKLEKLAAGFKNFGFGMVYPVYSEYSLRGVPVNGLNLEYQWQERWSVGFVGAQSQRTTLSVDSLGGQLKRMFFGSRIGYGKTDGNHVHFNFLAVKDSEGDIAAADSGLYMPPRQNYVGTLDFNYELLKDKLTIRGEVGGALYASNTRQAAISKIEAGDSQQQLQSGVFSDIAFKLVTAFRPDQKSQLSLEISRVGATYVTLGAPNLRNDIFHVGLQGQRRFLKNEALTLRANIIYEFDNLKSIKPSTTTNELYLIGVQYRFLKSMMLNSTYTYISQANGQDMGLYAMDEISHLLMNSVMMPHKIKNLNCHATVTYLYQNTSSLQLGERQAHNLQVRERITFAVPVTITLMAGGNYVVPTEQKTLISEVGVQWQANKKVSLGLGVNYGSEVYLSDKLGVFVSGSYQPFQKLSIELQGNFNRYQHSIVRLSNYNEGIAVCRVKYVF